jgi:Amt family ammonium transporter
VQFLGVATIGIYAFGISYIVLSMLNKVIPLRVNARDERIGLNISEHGATTSILDLITQMDEQARSGDFSKPVEVEPETEAAPIAAFYNTVLEKFLLETGRRQMAMQKLNQMANYDALTGLVNRRFFFESIKRALSRANRNQSGGAVLYFDLDGFKAVNDNFGHEAGDQILKETAIRLAQCVRENDILSRLGGDEFALLIEDTKQPTKNSCQIADKIIQSIGEPFEYEGESLQIGISVGIATFDPDHQVNVKTLVGSADKAMYQAKLAGKGVYRLHESEEQ